MDLYLRCTSQSCREAKKTPKHRQAQFQDLSALISYSQLYIPSLTAYNLSTINSIEALVAQDFGSLPEPYDPDAYTKFQLRLHQWRGLLDALGCLSDIKSNLTCNVDTCGNTSSKDIIVHNLFCLRQHTLEVRLYIESILPKALNAHPVQTAEILQSIMDSVARSRTTLPHLSQQGFRTIGVGQWLDDEVINFFVTKWCSKSQTTLGLSTWFACKFLFQGHLCTHAKTGILSSVDEKGVEKWCRAAEVVSFVRLGKSTNGEQKVQGCANWDRVFIPINENNTHWYSACINFDTRRIEIYDSLREVCLSNRQKPLSQRKNTKAMLVLMWLTEVLGRIRGEEVELKKNQGTMWRCDPHSIVPFQSNGYDCGVHLLWHLQHIIEFSSVQSDCKVQRLKFSDNMVSQRLQLVQEVLDDVHEA